MPVFPPCHHSPFPPSLILLSRTVIPIICAVISFNSLPSFPRKREPIFTQSAAIPFPFCAVIPFAFPRRHNIFYLSVIPISFFAVIPFYSLPSFPRKREPIFTQSAAIPFPFCAVIPFAFPRRHNIFYLSVIPISFFAVIPFYSLPSFPRKREPIF
ncbi:MAG TPA: hypothetical protein PKH33_09360 [bacterium]|nr:hypothetical protein [bacterium]